MPLVDDRGRLFGRLNVVDAVLVVLALSLVPLGIASYTLFRTPPPVLSAVSPATTISDSRLRVTVRGENLRPYMRVSLGNYQGRSFHFLNTTEAEVEFADVPPGVYDVVLYDVTQEQARLPKAMTITPSALPDSQAIVVGTIANLTAAQAATIKPGMVFTGVGEVLAIGKPAKQSTRVLAGNRIVEIPLDQAMQVPVTIRLSCYVRTAQGQPECAGAGVALRPLALLFIETPMGTLPLQVEQVRSLAPLEPVRVTVRFSGDPGVLAHITKGDTDASATGNELAATATVDTAGSTGTSQREVDLVVQAQRSASGWVYGDGPLRLGGVFVFRTAAYEAQGHVIRLTPPFTPGGPVR
jgi:hypothetical protein